MSGQLTISAGGGAFGPLIVTFRYPPSVMCGEPSEYCWPTYAMDLIQRELPEALPVSSRGARVIIEGLTFEGRAS